jgi:hypothetical protein
MCPLLALPLPKAFLGQPLTVLTRQTGQAVHAVNQSIFNMMSMVLVNRRPKIYKKIVDQVRRRRQLPHHPLHPDLHGCPPSLPVLDPGSDRGQGPVL